METLGEATGNLKLGGLNRAAHLVGQLSASMSLQIMHNNHRVLLAGNNA